MNANELADYLLNFIMTVEDYDESKHERAATMLRQQQAEIEALKQQLVTTSSEAKLNYNKGHEDGRKLAVVKQITDEEILDFINAFCLDMGDYWELTEKNATPMIKAILRRAQEK